MRNANRNWTWPIRIAGVVGFLATVYIIVFYHPQVPRTPIPYSINRELAANRPAKPLKPFAYSHALEGHIEHLREIERWQPPAGMKVVGLVFYGRRRFVSILNCYLQRNLIDNGGIIGEFLFVVKTEDKDDLAYLEQLLAENPKYKAQYTPPGGFDYSHMWSAVERGNVYVKIDDDVLYIEDSTIRSIVKKKVEHPEYIIVSANLVVQFAFAWVHYHLGAIHPYLPEVNSSNEAPITTWRKSQLPYWDGPEDFNVTSYVPSDHHRWLPLAPGTGSNEKTPISDVKYVVGGSGWNDWRVGAQQHYSFLENLEKDELWRYAFDLWDVHYDRLSINLMAITGDDVIDMGPMPKDDEELITQIYSKKTGRHVVADGHGIAVHHAYWMMGAHDGLKGMETTDVLDRYRAYAQENICMS